MRNFRNTFETRKISFLSALSICMTVPLKNEILISKRVLHILENKGSIYTKLASETFPESRLLGFPKIKPRFNLFYPI